MREYTKRHNVNRGHMKLQVWNEALELFSYAYKVVSKIRGLDFKLRAQILDSIQSISANIAEGYCRRTINEYLQFLNIALGSSGESMIRINGLAGVDLVSRDAFEEFDKLHYAVENKLLALIRSLQIKRRTNGWVEHFPEQ